MTVDNAVIVGNSASGLRAGLASGGGLSLGQGGMLIVRNSTFVNNSASLFGGGMALGSDSTSTCGLQLLDGSVFEDNLATHGGGQVYMTCSADMVVDRTVLHLSNVESQVSCVVSRVVQSATLVGVSLPVVTVRRVAVPSFPTGWPVSGLM